MLFVALFAGCRGAEMTSGLSVSDADNKPVVIGDSSRVVAIGTATTETIYALGLGSKLVGVDNPSKEYLPQSKDLPTVGAARALNAEGIVSLKPTLVILGADSAPPQIFDQLRAAKIAVLTVTPNYTPETVKQKISVIAKALNAEAAGKTLADKVDIDLRDAAQMLENKRDTPRVMFIGKGPNMPNATMSGAGTTIDEMINLAGGSNPFTDFTGFREMTDEAVVAAQPDVILMTEKSFERSGGVDGVLKFPGVANTPAGKNRRIVAVSDMYFQGFGPGVGAAVKELVKKFHPEIN